MFKLFKEDPLTWSFCVSLTDERGEADEEERLGREAAPHDCEERVLLLRLL